MNRLLFITVIMQLLVLASCASFQPSNPSDQLKQIKFDNKNPNPDYKFSYADSMNNEYLRNLRVSQNLDKIVSISTDDFEKIKTIVDWTSKQWLHNGSNTPSSSDPLTILKEAKEGKMFRCVEYGIVSSAALSSIGFPSRVLALKTADVSSVKFNAGHVVAETYSKELNKWIFIDAQFNAIPLINRIPLNAVEFQKAIYENNQNLKIVNKQGVFSIIEQEEYITWIRKYLYYFDIHFDNEFRFDANKKTVMGKESLMLIPIKAKKPAIFQRKYPIDYCLYTNNVNDFYQQPY